MGDLMTVAGPSRDLVLCSFICDRCGHSGLQNVDRRNRPRANTCLCCLTPSSPDKHGQTRWHPWQHRGDEQAWLLTCCTTGPGELGSLHRADGQTEAGAEAEDAEADEDEHEEEELVMAKPDRKSVV